jgi:hypothetical protein
MTADDELAALMLHETPDMADWEVSKLTNVAQARVTQIRAQLDAPSVTASAPVAQLAPPGRTGTTAPSGGTTLSEVHDVFRRWLGETYDMQALDAVLAVAAVEQLDGDPVWLMVISGAGNAKTETVGSLAGAGAHVTSTIASEGALLSGTGEKDRAKDATGGLLRKIGPRGLVVLKDFTSTISQGRDARAAVLAALREVYDGLWERNVGTDGGRTLRWQGRIVLVAACTSAYDTHHAVIAAMGDRFALVRVDSRLGRVEASDHALGNLGSEVVMRTEMHRVVGELLRHVDVARAVLPPDPERLLTSAANLVTNLRTAVDRDVHGRIGEAHQPEMPTRFTKMLGQVVRGGRAIGLSEGDAVTLAMRIAHDSMPPLRLIVLVQVGAQLGMRIADIARALQRPRSSVERVLHELLALRLLDIEPHTLAEGGDGYWLSSEVEADVLARLLASVVSPSSRNQEC